MRDREWLNSQLDERTGRSSCSPDPRLDDGLDEAEVISLALCRNPTLRAELTRIDAARATLDEARRVANPQLTLMGPFGPITALASLLAPLESLWQLPARSEAAARDADMIAEAVLMRALDLLRDARLLHVEWALAMDRAAVRADLERVAMEVARLASVRLVAGDVSLLDERVLFSDAASSTDARESAQREVTMARARLVAALALDALGNDARPVFPTESSPSRTLDELVALARAARPDARAAAFAVSAAAARAGWERSRIVNLGALVETQWSQPVGPALRLGGRLELPLFHQNQGGTGRAEAEVLRATAQHEVTARAIVMEITLAHARLEQSTRSRERFERDVLPALESALERARTGFEAGDQPFFVVLDVLRRVGEARLRLAELIAEQRRARCELERSVGARLSAGGGS
jgi:cobalt-zinc-cadmium efflux system outer membrane protein